MDDNLKFERDEYRRKMNIAFAQVKKYEDKINDQQKTEAILTKRNQSLEQDVISITKTMTDNIIQSNTEKQSLREEIVRYKEEIRILKK